MPPRLRHGRCHLCGRPIRRKRDAEARFCSNAHRQAAYRLRAVLPSEGDLLRALAAGVGEAPIGMVRDRARYLVLELRTRAALVADQLAEQLTRMEAYDADWPGTGHAMAPRLRRGSTPRRATAPASPPAEGTPLDAGDTGG